MKANVIVLSTNPYRIIDEQTGSINEGISMQYIMGDSLAPYVDPNSKLKGYRVLKGSVPITNNDQLSQIPALMEAEFDVKADASGKATLKPISLKFLSALQKSEK